MAGMGLYLFLSTASHGVLDALTDGGLGVAFFSPFDQTRYFFPFRHRDRLGSSSFDHMYGESLFELLPLQHAVFPELREKVADPAPHLSRAAAAFFPATRWT